MTEPTTPTGRAFVGVDEMHEYTQSHRRAIAEDIEREERERLLIAHAEQHDDTTVSCPTCALLTEGVADD